MLQIYMMPYIYGNFELFLYLGFCFLSIIENRKCADKICSITELLQNLSLPLTL